MRKSYGTAILSLGVILLLGFAELGVAQTRTRARSTSGSSARRATTQTQSRSGTASRARATSWSQRTARATSSTQRSTRGTSQANPTRGTRARTTARANPTRGTVRINVAPGTGNRGTASRTRVRDANNQKPRTGGGSQFRNQQRPPTSGYVLTTRPTSRNRDRDGRRDRDYDRGYERGYDRGYDHGYDRGYYRGYYRGHRTSGFYLHHHHYGPHNVYGFHYGGFGFYSGRWHFAIVIGSPIIVHHRYRYYGYDWWDSRARNLYSWDSAVRSYPANYNFDLSRASCVSLWIRATDGKDYVLQADPRFWNARDPGDLYAILWGQLEREGYVEIQDLNGVIHTFPAGSIQQIEATACR